MFATVKTPVFIDSVIFEFSQPAPGAVRAFLRDEEGSICSRFDARVPSGLKSYRWNGLNDLPYGRYTLEILRGGEAQKLKLIKRV